MATVGQVNIEDRLVYTPDELVSMLGVSRPLIYRSLKLNQIPHIRIGRLIRIPKSAFYQWLLDPQNGIPSINAGNYKAECTRPRHRPNRPILTYEQAAGKLISAILGLRDDDIMDKLKRKDIIYESINTRCY